MEKNDHDVFGSHNPLDGLYLNDDEKDFIKSKELISLLKNKKNKKTASLSELKTLEQLEIWLKWNFNNKDYVSFEKFGSILFFLSNRSSKMLNTAQKYFKEKFANYIPYFSDFKKKGY